MPSSSGLTRTVKPKKPIRTTAMTAASAMKGPGTPPAWHGLADAVLAAAENLFKIRLLAAGSRGARAPGATAAALPTAAPALIAPRHDETSSRYVVKGGAKDRPCGAIS